jgi:perosamine synthetase
MAKNKLALLGGDPIRKKPFSVRKTMGENEKKKVLEVLESGDISLFFGSPGPFFLGGPKIKEFEKKWADKFNYKHAISVNSWTTGLMTCVGAVGIGPGDEVICAPYSMSATSTSILFYGGIPVFVDIDPKTFCIDPKKIEALITPRTKAIMLVHLFGQPADMDEIIRIAEKHNLRIIEDAAHAPGAKYKGKYVGALKDIGGFSFNYHKHIHSGEGGVIVTNDDDLALRAQMIRNHGENVIEAYQVEDLTNCIGANYRMTELQAAIATVQTDNIEGYVQHRNELVNFFQEKISHLSGLTPAVLEKDKLHSFYIYPMTYKEEVVGIPRSLFVKAVLAEFPTPEIWEQTPLVEGYVKPLYLNPIYQKKMAMGSKGFPFNYNSGVTYNYAKGLCPVAERMYEKELIHSPLIREAVTESDMNDVANAMIKVFENIDELKRNL